MRVVLLAIALPVEPAMLAAAIGPSGRRAGGAGPGRPIGRTLRR
ncbi:hypothetical protein GA0070614_2675 [Micromonospora coxensis]|uniref:Uncharacterized protein n=1 Tax=Micromonospora coxensis TaxID=356852 RepID=A0A1C5IG71_9ACTN|nr:hypothetical protein GA0070614_2675 [Micromonospora coxensis]